MFAGYLIVVVSVLQIPASENVFDSLSGVLPQMKQQAGEGTDQLSKQEASVIRAIIYEDGIGTSTAKRDPCTSQEETGWYTEALA
jgi:hypothetical protein